MVPLHAKKDLAAPALHPANPQAAHGEPQAEQGLGAFVQRMHEQGLRRQALAAAIHAEQKRRGIGHGKGKPGMPPGQAKFKKAKGKRK